MKISNWRPPAPRPVRPVSCETVVDTGLLLGATAVTALGTGAWRSLAQGNFPSVARSVLEVGGLQTTLRTLQQVPLAATVALTGVAGLAIWNTWHEREESHSGLRTAAARAGIALALPAGIWLAAPVLTSGGPGAWLTLSVLAGSAAAAAGAYLGERAVG